MAELTGVDGIDGALRRADARANQARVLEAARSEFAEHGLAADVKDIAERAGVGVATIYRGFGSKQELLLATIRQAASSLTTLIEETERIEDPVEAMREFIVRVVGYVDSYGWLIQASLDEDIAREFKASMGPQVDFRSRMRGLVERGVRSGAYAADLPLEVVILLLRGMIFSLSFKSRHGGELPDACMVADGVVQLLQGKSQGTK